MALLGNTHGPEVGNSRGPRQRDNQSISEDDWHPVGTRVREPWINSFVFGYLKGLDGQRDRKRWEVNFSTRAGASAGLALSRHPFSRRERRCRIVTCTVPGAPRAGTTSRNAGNHEQCPSYRRYTQTSSRCSMTLSGSPIKPSRAKYTMAALVVERNQSRPGCLFLPSRSSRDTPRPCTILLLKS